MEDMETQVLTEDEKGQPEHEVDRPEEKRYQRLHLCTYLSELPEIVQGDTEDLHLKNP